MTTNEGKVSKVQSFRGNEKNTGKDKAPFVFLAKLMLGAGHINEARDLNLQNY